MADPHPSAEIDDRYGSPGAKAIPWTVAWQAFDQAEIYWLSTVRADGRPHITPVVAVSLDGVAYISSGPEEQKVQNLAGNAHCILMTGTNKMATSLDVVLEGDAVRVTDAATLGAVAAAYGEKYDEPFHFVAGDGVLNGGAGGDSFVFRIEPAKAFCFGRGADVTQTRYRFPRR
ncbi:MAG TPA: pyridoxamine 5'-phosphate oxidase family protein [Candidatus Limnocylindrales bacterium]